MSHSVATKAMSAHFGIAINALAADFSGSVLTLDGARDVWRGSLPTRDYVDASGSIVVEARRNGRSEERART